MRQTTMTTQNTQIGFLVNRRKEKLLKEVDRCLHIADNLSDNQTEGRLTFKRNEYFLCFTLFLNMAACNMMRILYLFLYHPLIKALPYVGDEFYVGCYEAFDVKFARYETVSVRECLMSCVERTYYFAAMTFEGDTPDCLCGNLNEHSKTVSTKNCLRPCQVNGLPCGDDKLYAVYTAAPTYLGCFKDNEIRDMIKATIQLEWMTNQYCFDLCSGKGKFAATQQGKQCFCADTYGKYGSIPANQCDNLCIGNQRQTCGGSWANSIYSIDHIPGLDLLYSDIFHCLDGSDVFGVCKSKACQPGWKGRKCNRRNCEVDNGNCGNNQCQEFQISNFFISECSCDGYSKSIYHNCENFSPD